MAFLALLSRIFTGQKNFMMEHKKGISLLFLTIFYFAYLALGGYIFCLIEGPQEAAEQEKLTRIKSTVMAKFPNVPEEAIDHLYEELSAAGVKGIIVKNSTTNWTYGNSFLFAMTLLTTIGYGHLSPATQFGKIVCMIYSSIGIPLTLVILALYVDVLSKLSDAFKANLFRRLGYQLPFYVRTLHFFLVMAFIIVGVFTLPACVFNYLEASWSYLDSIYFCFISLTTVGLGDFVPGIAVHHPHVELYRFLATVYLLVGVTVVMFMMGLAGDYWQNCNKGFHIIPVRIVHEETAIKPENPPSYGAIIIPEINVEKRLLLP